jgi:hypothetical protein
VSAFSENGKPQTVSEIYENTKSQTLFGFFENFDVNQNLKV